MPRPAPGTRPMQPGPRRRDEAGQTAGQDEWSVIGYGEGRARAGSSMRCRWKRAGQLPTAKCVNEGESPGKISDAYGIRCRRAFGKAVVAVSSSSKHELHLSDHARRETSTVSRQLSIAHQRKSNSTTLGRARDSTISVPCRRLPMPSTNQLGRVTCHFSPFPTSTPVI
ncbi:uncharacterized protein IWZ02DRAFT_155818 [Phyllosticta citriasiana]|uniref:uncharacterized protein n=1 Tax=Phyllosticta citriasiana TaxID=595635 RepID=UPI0030FD8E70